MTVTAPYIDTVPSSITDDGLEEAFEEVVPCESSHAFRASTGDHTDGFPCAHEAIWRVVNPCVHSYNICQARYDYLHSNAASNTMLCVRCGTGERMAMRLIKFVSI